MSKKRIFLIIAGALLLAFLLIFKYPKNFEDIIPDPYTFENNGVHICVGVGVAKTEENVNYDILIAALCICNHFH